MNSALTKVNYYMIKFSSQKLETNFHSALAKVNNRVIKNQFTTVLIDQIPVRSGHLPTLHVNNLQLTLVLFVIRAGSTDCFQHDITFDIIFCAYNKKTNVRIECGRNMSLGL